MDLADRVASLLEATEVQEFGGGHQSRVFRVVRHNGEVVVAKVSDATMVDRHDLDARLEVTATLADVEPRVCRPLPVDSRLLTEITLPDGEHVYVVCFEFARGLAPDPGLPADAEQMGATLAGLHAAMSRLPPARLPLVAALRAPTPGPVPDGGPRQLLHGDFSAGNLRTSDGVTRIFDLDDCGYGPPVFDVANALYMVLFDSFTQSTPATYQTFRAAFVGSYADTAGVRLSAETLDQFIDLRVEALGGWLDDLDRAPIGIRTATPEWHATLRTFVRAQRPTSR